MLVRSQIEVTNAVVAEGDVVLSLSQFKLSDMWSPSVALQVVQQLTDLIVSAYKQESELVTLNDHNIFVHIDRLGFLRVLVQ